MKPIINEYKIVFAKINDVLIIRKNIREKGTFAEVMNHLKM